MAALLVLEPGARRTTPTPAPYGRIDLLARSRQFLRRGLVLSGALHLALVYAFLFGLSLTAEEPVEYYLRPTEIFRQPPATIEPPPETQVTPAVVTANTDQGMIQPVVDRLDFSEVSPIGPSTATPVNGTPSGPEKEVRGGTPGPSNDRDPNIIYTVAQVEEEPVPIHTPKPVYPTFEREAGIEGKVLMRVLVDEHGAVGNVSRQSGNQGLANAAADALRQWRFRPARMNGKPVSVWVEIPVRFEL